LLKVKSKVDLFVGASEIIPKGTVLNVKINENNAFYTIIDGPYKGNQYWIHHFDKHENLYSEHEWIDMKNQYLTELEKERAAKERAIEMVSSLSTQIVKKNKEIEKLNFFVSALAIGLSASSEAIQAIREKEKV
jgi:hypothetical protein